MAHLSPPAHARLRGLVLLRAWQAAAIGGVALLAAYRRSATGLDDFYNRYWYNPPILMAAVATVVGPRRRDRARRVGRLASGLVWAVGELLFDFAYGADPPFPSGRGRLHLAFYPACYAGVLLVRSQISEFGRMLWLDGAMAAIAAGAPARALPGRSSTRTGARRDRHQPGLPTGDTLCSRR